MKTTIITIQTIIILVALFEACVPIDTKQRATQIDAGRSVEMNTNGVIIENLGVVYLEGITTAFQAHAYRILDRNNRTICYSVVSAEGTSISCLRDVP